MTLWPCAWRPLQGIAGMSAPVISVLDPVVVDGVAVNAVREDKRRRRVRCTGGGWRERERERE